MYIFNSKEKKKKMRKRKPFTLENLDLKIGQAEKKIVNGIFEKNPERL